MDWTDRELRILFGSYCYKFLFHFCAYFVRIMNVMYAVSSCEDVRKYTFSLYLFVPSFSSL